MLLALLALLWLIPQAGSSPSAAVPQAATATATATPAAATTAPAVPAPTSGGTSGGAALSSASFCNGFDGSLAGCPCNNPGDMASGCDTPIPPMAGGGTTGGVLLESVLQLTSPLNRATLRALGMPMSSTPAGILFRNDSLDPAAPVVFGDGIRCVNGAGVVRLGVGVGVAGVSQHRFGHGPNPGSGMFYYQLWLRSTPMSYCDPAAAFNQSNGIVLVW